MPVQRLLRYRTALLATLGASLTVFGLLLEPLGGSAIQAGTTKLSFTSPTPSVAPGTSFQAQVKITDGANVGGWEADLGYNPYIVRVQSVDAAPSTAFLQVNSRTAGVLGPLTNNADGTLALGGYSYGSNMNGANGSATLANVTLQSLLPGTTALDLVSGQLATPDAIGSLITGGDAQDGSVTVTGQGKYIAGGTTGANYASILTLYNAGNAALPLSEIFVNNSGTVIANVESIPANGRKTIYPDQLGLTADEFSTLLGASNNDLVAELGTYWKNYQNTTANPDGRTGTGAFGMRATDEAFTTQYFALGFFSSYWDNQLVLLNPTLTQDANVTITFVQQNGTVRTLNQVVPKGKRVSISIDQTLPAMVNNDYSTRVNSDVPVMAEMRYTYTKRNATGDGTGGFAMRGAPSGHTRQFFALGYNKNDATNASKEQWVNFLALYNYGAQTATVTVTYTKQLNGQAAGTFVRNFTINAGQRFSYKVSNDAQMRDVDYSTEIVSSQPIIAELGYYYDQYNQFVQKSDGFAMRGAGAGAQTQLFATGYTGPAGASDGFLWVNYMALVNPNNASVTATITHYNDNGGTIASYNKTIPARGRLSYRVDLEPGGTRTMEGKSFSTKVSTPGLPIIAELGIYFKDFGSGALSGVGGGYAMRGMPR